jgi:mono/diheme cytochrome c family protein
MMRRLLVPGILIGLTGVSLWAFPWTRDMVDSPAIRPQSESRTPPPGVVTIDGVRVWDRTEADSKLVNPVEATPQVLSEGAALYAVNCAVCHGAAGGGDGTIASHFPGMPDLTVPAVQEYTDGWLYSVIREGGFNMPSQAEALSPRETWTIVHHVRSFGRP